MILNSDCLTIIFLYTNDLGLCLKFKKYVHVYYILQQMRKRGLLKKGPKDLQALEYMCSNGFRPTYDYFCYSLKKGYLDIADFILKQAKTKFSCPINIVLTLTKRRDFESLQFIDTNNLCSDFEYEHAFDVAIKQGSLVSIEFLIKKLRHGHHTDYLYGSGCNREPYTICIKNDYLPIIKYLYDSKVFFIKPFIHMELAIAWNRFDIILFFLSIGIECPDKLFLSCYRDLPMVKFFITNAKKDPLLLLKLEWMAR